MAYLSIDHPLISAELSRPLSFTTNEGLSSDFCNTLLLQCNQKLEAKDLLGTLITVSITHHDGHGRYFNGYISHITDMEVIQEQHKYELTIQSSLVFLKKNHRSQIYQQLTLNELIGEILINYSFIEYKIEFSADYEPREYCVQYMESDFDFLNRIMENEGVWYYFCHSPDKHQLVITDQQQFPSFEVPYKYIDFITDGEAEKYLRREGIFSLSRESALDYNEIIFRDYDYLAPEKNLQVHASLDKEGVPQSLTRYEYAAGYTESGRGERLAKMQLESVVSHAFKLQGEGNVLGLYPGKMFILSHHPDEELNQSYKVSQCSYRYSCDDEMNTGHSDAILCQFSVVKKEIAWRPPKKTPRPLAPTLQSATVVGPPGVEVYTDRLARIKVHFHWDREHDTGADCSCWIRVSQPWAGNGSGILTLPRAGQEVLISYIDGDIDRPIMTGTVYNAVNLPPYSLPEQSHCTGIKSRSLNNGTVHQANHLTLDDKAGEERIILHAERDFHETVEGKQFRHIGSDRLTKVNGVTYDWFTDHVALKDYTFSFTGCSVAFTGANFGFTAANTGVTGVNTSFTSVNCGYTFSNNIMTGIQLMMMGTGNHFIGVLNELKPVANFLTGSNNSVTGVNSAITGINNNFIDSNNTCIISNLGYIADNTSFIGINTSVTGTAFSTTGNSISQTLSAMNTTGSAINNTGSSVSATGSSISTTGMALSYTGVGLSQLGVDLKSVGMQSKN
ncbi:type VI secretion system tip protein VgrG [Enterobacteriaceae bacterium RIT693]|jgi:type VI secretion system secreted protein VgrG|nr:type VI secretion system tip protein VgrG [Enterobacteriaceae bacterium RIT693]